MAPKNIKIKHEDKADAKEKANILRRVIRKKNLIQYERRNIFQSEAEEIVKAATRFYQWVEEHIQ